MWNLWLLKTPTRPPRRATTKGIVVPKRFCGLTELLGSRSVSDKNTKATQASCRPIQLEDLCTNTMAPLSLQWACRCFWCPITHSKVEGKASYFLQAILQLYSGFSISRIRLSIWWLQGKLLEVECKRIKRGKNKLLFVVNSEELISCVTCNKNKCSTTLSASLSLTFSPQSTPSVPSLIPQAWMPWQFSLLRHAWIFRRQRWFQPQTCENISFDSFLFQQQIRSNSLSSKKKEIDFSSHLRGVNSTSAH